MSRMSDFILDIEERLLQGYSARQIAMSTGFSFAFIKEFEEAMNESLGNDDYDESMDGDFDSAMASAGYGTDEDYGYYAEE
jgi:hypothetical protein